MLERAALRAARRRPLAVHDGRLGAVLTVPHTTQWMIERLGADHSAVCHTSPVKSSSSSSFITPRPLLAVPNVTAHPSTASVPITVLLC